MKKILCICLLAISFLSTFSCKEVTDMDGKTLTLNDSIVASNIFPTHQALHVELNADRTEITVVIGDLKFYNATDEERSAKAKELGDMIVRIYGTENYLNEGTLIVTKDVRNTSNTPKDGIATPIDLEKIKELLYKK